MKIKKFIALILSILIATLNIYIIPLSVEAKGPENYISSYVGTFDGDRPMQFKITSYDTNLQKFTGYLYLNDALIVIDREISGTAVFYPTYYECHFEFNYKWLFTSYDAAFNLKVDACAGKVTGEGGGGVLFYSDNILLTGDINRFYNESFSYSENDMKMCMSMSSAMYNGDDEKIIKEDLESLLNKKYKYPKKYPVEAYNYTNNDNPNDVAFAILARESIATQLDIIVVIRGTYYDEWRGNTQITGNYYNPDILIHDNFNKAKESINEKITDYYNKFSKSFNKVNLIITGHSRGAAVANLYAKEATDVINNETTDSKVPRFGNVVAYTFACPNVVKVTKENPYEEVEKYNNIYNYWFNSDIVPSVPLTNPIEGWGYWKYGRSYTMNISDCEYIVNSEGAFNRDYFFLYAKTLSNRNIQKELGLAFSQWASVEDYYNRPIQITVDGEVITSTTLYEFLYDIASFKNLENTRMFVRAIADLLTAPQLAPIAGFIVSNIVTIVESHHYDNYNLVINGKDDKGGLGDSRFELFTYKDAVDAYSSLQTDKIVATYSNDAEIEYNTAESEKLKAFAQSEGNNDILQWDLENPSSWKGVEWNETGNVSKIDFTYKWLKGSLDCSDFADLTELTLFANSLENINLFGASALTELNCSYNNLGENGLNLSNCNALTKLYCDGCSLNTLDVSKLTELSALSCAFNNLIALNIENNTKLNHINCIYNYLDVHDGSALNTQLKKYRSENKAYVNYFEQSVPDDAVFDEDEWYMLSEIARVYKIHDALDWYDENGNISLEKMQNNVIFEYDGSKYRAAVIDLGNCYGGWDMDFSKFTKLKALYCDDSTVCGLDLSGCNELTTLVCTDAKIYNIEFPTSATTADSKLTVLECENNFIRFDKFPDGLIENIKSKQNYSLKYRKQFFPISAERIYPDDYNALVDFANQQVDYKALDWISVFPDNWYNINWIYDEKTDKYRILDCDFSGLDVRGNIDFSKCDMLENLSLRGTDISTAKVPAGVIDENTFKNCSNLSAVIVSDGTEIADNTFFGCPSLQAVYIPSTVEKIGANAFDDSKNIAFAGESGSYAESYAKAQSKPFKPGFFICGNVVEKSDSKDWIPIKNAEIISGETTVATTDKNGFFVIFSLENGDCSLSVKANDSKTATIEATIENSPTVLDLISV